MNFTGRMKKIFLDRVRKAWLQPDLGKDNLSGFFLRLKNVKNHSKAGGLI
jgi:hypothetical protein